MNILLYIIVAYYVLLVVAMIVAFIGDKRDKKCRKH